MSFILDALRKAEHARQMSTGASLAELPIGRRSRGLPWWVFALCALLLVNVAVLALVLMRKSEPPQSPSVQIPAQPSASAPAAASILAPTVTAAPTQVATPAARNALADEALPAPQVEYETVPRAELEIANAAASVPDGPTLVRPIDPSQPMPSASASAPTDLHVDMHVYSDIPRDRFVVINMKRYTEGQTLPGGGLIEQITADGVMVYRNGSRFILNR